MCFTILQDPAHPPAVTVMHAAAELGWPIAATGVAMLQASNCRKQELGMHVIFVQGSGSLALLEKQRGCCGGLQTQRGTQGGMVGSLPDTPWFKLGGPLPAGMPGPVGSVDDAICFLPGSPPEWPG